MIHSCLWPVFRGRLILVGLTLFPCEGVGAQIHALEAEKRVACMISKTHMNRIQIEGDRIAAVYGADHTYVMETDDVLGQVFLKAVSPALIVEPVYLSIVTEGDVTQDLKLIPSNTEAQTLIFKQASLLQSGLSTVGPQAFHPQVGSVGMERTLLHFIRELTVSETQMPEIPAPDVSEAASGARADLKLRLKGQIERGGLTGQVFNVENSGKSPLTLDPQMMAKALARKVLAVAFEKETLAAGQTTRMFIVSAVSDTSAQSQARLSQGDGS